MSVCFQAKGQIQNSDSASSAEKVEADKPLGLLDSQPSLLDEFQASKRPCLTKAE